MIAFCINTKKHNSFLDGMLPYLHRQNGFIFGVIMSDWISVDDELPKSGVPVIVYVQNVYGDKTRILRAQYAAINSLHANMDHADDFAAYDEETDEYWCPEGWYETNEFEGCHYAIEGDVTHWMPLPEPPKD